MNRRFEITDDESARLEPLLPSTEPRRGGRFRDHRQVLNGILFRTRSGIPWRDLPERYGPWDTAYKRFARWQADGAWARVEACLRTQADAAGELDWEAQIDSTVVRVHQHAAGAPQRGLTADAAARQQALGRSGWADHQAPHHLRRPGPQPSNPPDPGQAADTRQLIGLVDQVRAAPPRCRSLGRGVHPFPQRPSPPGQAKLAMAGPAELVTCDQTIERLMNRRKQFRAVATRYGCEDNRVPSRVVV